MDKPSKKLIESILKEFAKDKELEYTTMNELWLISTLFGMELYLDDFVEEALKVIKKERNRILTDKQEEDGSKKRGWKG